jgi:PAS domain-containing protein
VSAAGWRLQELLEAIADPFFVLDGRQRCHFANTAAALLIGPRSSSKFGLSAPGALSNLHDPHHLDAVRRSVVDRAPGTCRLVGAGGRVYRAYIRPLRRGAAVLCREVTRVDHRKGHS